MVRRLYGDGRTNLLFVGRIIPNKKIDDLIRVFAVYQRYVDPRSRLLLVGDYRGHERYYDGCRRWSGGFDLDEVVFTGQVDDDDLLAYYSVADLFLCLSEHEGFCVPLVEAMIFGLPVMAYDAGAVRETLRGGGIAPRRRRAGDRGRARGRPRGRQDPCAEAVLATQARAMREIRQVDFGALLMERLAPVLERPVVRVDQWVPALHRGDAIGDSARLMRDAFRSWGYGRRLRPRGGRGPRRGRPPFAEWRAGRRRTSSSSTTRFPRR